MKQVVLTDFLTEDEIKRVVMAWNHRKMGHGNEVGWFAKTICAEVIQPNIARINKALGQENVPMFLAYAVEYVMTMAAGRDLKL